MASWSAYMTRYGVMIPVLSAGSNQEGVRATCTPKVNWPGTLAWAGSVVAARPMAERASKSLLDSTRLLSERPDDAVMVFSLKRFIRHADARSQAAKGQRSGLEAQETLARS